MKYIPCLLNSTSDLYIKIYSITGTSLVVQWLRLRASTAGGMGSIPGGGTKDPACYVAAN